jgi:hypothetical protein
MRNFAVMEVARKVAGQSAGWHYNQKQLLTTTFTVGRMGLEPMTDGL